MKILLHETEKKTAIRQVFSVNTLQAIRFSTDSGALRRQCLHCATCHQEQFVWMGTCSNWLGQGGGEVYMTLPSIKTNATGV